LIFSLVLNIVPENHYACKMIVLGRIAAGAFQSLVCFCPLIVGIDLRFVRATAAGEYGNLTVYRFWF
jgi:hypothetical protein